MMLPQQMIYIMIHIQSVFRSVNIILVEQNGYCRTGFDSNGLAMWKIAIIRLRYRK